MIVRIISLLRNNGEHILHEKSALCMKGNKMRLIINEEKIITGDYLYEKWMEEREKQGLPEIPPVNRIGVLGAGTFARMDKSWKWVPGYYLKMTGEKSHL